MGRPKKLIKDTCKVEYCMALSVAKGNCARHNYQVKTHGRILKTAHDRRKPTIYADRLEYELQNGQKAIFDKDFEAPTDTAATISQHGYAMFGKQYAHRLVMQAPKGVEVDHVNHDRLDNRKSNLRLCTGYENNKNRPIAHDNKSGYMGVHFSKAQRKWVAQIQVDKKTHHIGTFTEAIEAAVARDREAVKYFGEFANLNFGVRR